jgi:hypothetical protein
MGPQPAFLGVARLTEATGYKIAIRLYDKEGEKASYWLSLLQRPHYMKRRIIKNFNDYCCSCLPSPFLRTESIVR